MQYSLVLLQHQQVYYEPTNWLAPSWLESQDNKVDSKNTAPVSHRSWVGFALFLQLLNKLCSYLKWSLMYMPIILNSCIFYNVTLVVSIETVGKVTFNLTWYYSLITVLSFLMLHDIWEWLSNIYLVTFPWRWLLKDHINGDMIFFLDCLFCNMGFFKGGALREVDWGICLVC